MKATPSNIYLICNTFFKPVNASLQNTSCDGAHYLNPTLQKMPMVNIWDPEFEVIAAAIAKDAMAAAAVEEKKLQSCHRRKIAIGLEL